MVAVAVTIVVTGMDRHSSVGGKLRWETPLRRECEVRIRFAEEAVLHRGEPYVWIGFGFENDREEERQISIALFLHSRRARSYAMRLLKQMGVRSLPSTGDLAEDAAQLVQAIEGTSLPAALGMGRSMEQDGKWRVVQIHMPGRRGA